VKCVSLKPTREMQIMTRRFLLAAIAVQMVILCLPASLKAQGSAAPALTGRVSSQAEGAMEGVLVTAKKEGATFAITVVSNAQGNYSFPRSRVEPGNYILRVRAAGYELYDGGPVEVTAAKVTQHDLKLSKTQNLAAQLSNQEWLMSAPGTETQKRTLLYCVSCHTLEREFRTDYNTGQFAAVVVRMHNWLNASTPQQPQFAPNGGFRFPNGVAEYLSTVNLSSGRSTWPFDLKTLPRPKGKATRVIITEYDLPRPYAQPHDVLPDSQGFVWYNDFGRQYIGRLELKTGKAVEYPVPILRAGFTGSHDLGFDREETPWLAMASQGGIGRFDRKTDKFQTWSVPPDPDAKPTPEAYESVPKEATATPANATRGGSGSPNVIGVRPQFSHVDGKVWLLLGGSRVQRIDIPTGQWLPESISVFKYIAKDSPAASRPG
jgi:virginiamycin B lyase